MSREEERKENLYKMGKLCGKSVASLVEIEGGCRGERYTEELET